MTCLTETTSKPDLCYFCQLQIRDVREELHKEAELELEKEKEKNQFLLQQCQLENSQLQQKVNTITFNHFFLLFDSGKDPPV